MLNKAMKTMETIRKAEETRTNLINEAVETLNVLGYDGAIEQRIVINKGHIVEVETVKEVQVTNEEELNRVYEENARHIRRINELAAENEKLIDENIELEGQIAFKDGQIISLKRTIAELEAQVAALQPAKEEVVIEETNEQYNVEKEEDVVIEQPKKERPKRKIKRAKEFTLDDAVVAAKAANEERQAKEEEEKAAVKATLPEYTLDYKPITFDETINAATKFGVCGTITIEGTAYKFKATNNHHMPIIYNCFDEATCQLAKDIMQHEIEKFNFMQESEFDVANFSHAKDEDFPLVVWRLADDKGNITYHGYTQAGRYNYALTWDAAKYDFVGRMLVDNLFTNATNVWKRLPNKELADKFVAVCKELYADDFQTNDVVVEDTNEDPTFGSDDLDL